MTHEKFEKSDLNTVKRLPKRGHYDRETIYSILDRQFLCHIAWQENGQPFMIPTAYGRKEDILYIHGSSKSRMLSSLADGRPICMVMTILDGLVLARSAFHHSMNYRSVVIYGHAREAEGEEKMEGVRIVSDQILPGRWNEVRLPTEIEMKATTVLAIHVDTASAKVRTGPPKDDEPDYTLPVWAGIIPITTTYHDPEPDPDMMQDRPWPESARRIISKPF